jgi:hypothetical protein
MRFGLLGAGAAACALLTACGSTTINTAQTSTHAAHYARHYFSKYAGLGATLAAFTHDNTIFCLNCSLFAGQAAYTIKAKRHGLVTEYDVAEAFKPAASAAIRLSLVAGTMIPGPITAPVRQARTASTTGSRD